MPSASSPSAQSGAVDDPRDELRFILLCRWAVQILDAWAALRDQVTPTASPTKWPFKERGAFMVLVRNGGSVIRIFDDTRDGARILAAQHLVEADPRLRRGIEDPPA